MVGAYERLFELFESGVSPPLHEDRIVQVTTERLLVHTEWRVARARVPSPPRAPQLGQAAPKALP
jgi:hypothetical protein